MAQIVNRQPWEAAIQRLPYSGCHTAADGGIENSVSEVTGSENTSVRTMQHSRIDLAACHAFFKLESQESKEGDRTSLVRLRRSPDDHSARFGNSPAHVDATSGFVDRRRGDCRHLPPTQTRVAEKQNEIRPRRAFICQDSKLRVSQIAATPLDEAWELNVIGGVFERTTITHSKLQHSRKYQVDLTVDRWAQRCAQSVGPPLDFPVSDVDEPYDPPSGQHMPIEDKAVARPRGWLDLDFRGTALRAEREDGRPTPRSLTLPLLSGSGLRAVVECGVEARAGTNKRFRAFNPNAVLLVSPSFDDGLPEPRSSRFIADLPSRNGICPGFMRRMRRRRASRPRSAVDGPGSALRVVP
jgi:hypothetical protein